MFHVKPRPRDRRADGDVAGPVVLGIGRPGGPEPGTGPGEIGRNRAKTPNSAESCPSGLDPGRRTRKDEPVTSSGPADEPLSQPAEVPSPPPEASAATAGGAQNRRGPPMPCRRHPRAVDGRHHSHRLLPRSRPRTQLRTPTRAHRAIPTFPPRTTSARICRRPGRPTPRTWPARPIPPRRPPVPSSLSRRPLLPRRVAHTCGTCRGSWPWPTRRVAWARPPPRSTSAPAWPTWATGPWSSTSIPQGNASTGLGINPRALESSMYDVLLNDVPLEDCIEGSSVRNLFVAPASLDLAGAEIELVPAFSRELRLKRAISEVLDDYDYVLIDCPPSLGLLTVNAMAAATEVLVPDPVRVLRPRGPGPAAPQRRPGAEEPESRSSRSAPSCW